MAPISSRREIAGSRRESEIMLLLEKFLWWGKPVVIAF
jgi:hypothetical protein